MIFRNVFNWTLTSRPDSDIWRPLHYKFVKHTEAHLGPFWDRFPVHYGGEGIPSLDL